MTAMPDFSLCRSASVLIVDDEPGMRQFLEKALDKHFGLVETAGSIDQAETLRQRYHFDLMILDVRMPGRSGIEWHEALQDPNRHSDVIFMTAYAELETAIQAIRVGAADFILKPFRLEQMMNAILRVLKRRQLLRENFLLRREVSQYLELENPMVGDSPAMKRLETVIQRVAPTPSAVLIEGESGTGKDLVARALHQHSGRQGPYVPVNCGAIAPDLLEAELFGHTRGAFTGANKARDGLFSFASGGTLFLDEIGELPLAMQSKLLRVLEQKAVRPVGGEQEVKVDVRIVAATNRQLSEEVKVGRFREDLYFRLNVLTLTLPPLRERSEDIPQLAHYFSRRLSRELGLEAVPFSHEDLRAMQGHHWTGNIRELKNFIERCILLGRLPLEELVRDDNTDSGQTGYPSCWPLDEVERRHILQVLDACDGNKSAAARQLGISRKTLDRKLAGWSGEDSDSDHASDQEQEA
ncbi:sigma-54-dependent transcriptional regulator [Marinospirillum alkaliphilum]|uniref:Two component, sigma54 specific, transcriptional regulator, Fis family n=1 Tax=Marinospirillum alkaliphilum DSM 21637 TaxID=1122209 RepID=A0A1K1ZNF5_9GAMM|nr:sigma-54 dependent transcriptional regulator [Marinospirillum alkaliphilum]SFX75689.1 two component, sigma54 specific, transcriptional regulator, Fis family [Marinospirillum alkaliphilum DSM 21637]